VRQLAGLEEPGYVVEPVITIAIISCIWLAIGLWRVRRLES
jgi:hypothetical protein